MVAALRVAPELSRNKPPTEAQYALEAIQPQDPATLNHAQVHCIRKFLICTYSHHILYILFTVSTSLSIGSSGGSGGSGGGKYTKSRITGEAEILDQVKR